MTPNELPIEKRIAAELSIPESPPVHPEEELNNPGPVEIWGEPPRTRLLLEGFDREEMTVDFLLDIYDLADDHGLSLDGISVRRDWSDL